MLKKININVYFKHINMNNYHKFIISLFLLFIHLSIFSQVDKFSFGLYCNAKFHYYPDDMKYLNDWFKYKYKFKNMRYANCLGKKQQNTISVELT